MPNKSDKNSVYLILDNIRSLYNVGAIFRASEAVQVKKIFLVGPTGILIPKSPQDKRKPILNPKLAKTALGTEKQVSWKHYWSIKETIKGLPANTEIIALEQTAKSIIFTKVKYKLPVALIVGNELTGVSKDALKTAKAIVHIPMYGKHKSLNVSVATGIALYHIKLNSKLSRSRLRRERDSVKF